MANRLTVKIANQSERFAASNELVRPNPGDMMMTLVFGWALFCFFLITVGDKLLLRISRLARNPEYEKLLLESDEALGLLMVVGSVVLVLTIYVFNNYPKFFLGSLPASFTFASASWPPLHDAAFILKYLSLIYLGVYTIFFLYKNFWRILGTPYVRLMLAFTAWTGLVCTFLGGRLEDIWYLGTVACIALGFAVFFIYEFNNKFGLAEFIKILSWGAAVTVFIHMTAPALSEEFIQNGRFQSYFIRATAFSVTLCPLVVILFWRAMTANDPQLRLFFIVVSLAGFALILWSGSRSPIAATLLGGGLLWLRFRNQLFLAMFIFAVLGVAVQLLFNVNEAVNTDEIASRLADTETGRYELWAKYFELAIESPVYGYSPSGLGFALAGDLGEFLGSLGFTEVDFESVHNSYLAIFMRFGGVGLILYLSLLIFALQRAKQVLFSIKVPDDEKQLMVLPASLILAISFTVIFEDAIPGTGKGNFECFVMFACFFICQVYGTRLINIYERNDSNGGEIPTLSGLHVAERTKVNV